MPVAHLSAVLVHGHLDISSPLEAAWELHQLWPASRIVVVEDAGHFGGSMNTHFDAAIVEMAALLDGRRPLPWVKASAVGCKRRPQQLRCEPGQK